MSTFHGPQPLHGRGEIMRQHRGKKRDEARKRQLKYKLEHRREGSEHEWLPQDNYECTCTTNGCIAVWFADSAHPPRTKCPQTRQPREKRDRRSKRPEQHSSKGGAQKP